LPKILPLGEILFVEGEKLLLQNPSDPDSREPLQSWEDHEEQPRKAKN
jgi:hypothetical protein